MSIAARISGWAEALLDGSILFSFDRSGFERHSGSFDPQDLEVDLENRICLITGANSGLGFAAASGLAARGATVVMLCRSRSRGDDARDQIRAETGNRGVSVAQIDLSDRSSIERFLRELDLPRIDVLINNAAVLLSERSENNEGIETTLATNLVGPMRLTEGLLGRLMQSSDPRVINVASGGMYAVRLQLDDPGWQGRKFDGVRAYAETKRALVVLTKVWAEQLEGNGIRCHSMHPGWADTPGVRRSLPGFWRRMGGRLRTPEQGSDTILWLAVAPRTKLGSGRFWFDRRAVTTHLIPWTRETDSERQRLLELCRDLQQADRGVDEHQEVA